ncbi:MAG: GIY-YIG nuclease family protein [Dehalococcoidia bacterium]|nr:GIY-YIG nuclease family protein [Dehalococcoidia bacterium]
MFYAYVLQSQRSGRYYIGSTGDVDGRLAQHNAGMTRSTRHSRPWELVHFEAHATLSEARVRERLIKSWKNPAYMCRQLGIDG